MPGLLAIHSSNHEKILVARGSVVAGFGIKRGKACLTYTRWFGKQQVSMTLNGLHGLFVSCTVHCLLKGECICCIDLQMSILKAAKQQLS